jgi:hypothetical protein
MPYHRTFALPSPGMFFPQIYPWLSPSPPCGLSSKVTSALATGSKILTLPPPDTSVPLHCFFFLCPHQVPGIRLAISFTVCFPHLNLKGFREEMEGLFVHFVYCWFPCGPSQGQDQSVKKNDSLNKAHILEEVLMFTLLSPQETLSLIKDASSFRPPCALIAAFHVPCPRPLPSHVHFLPLSRSFPLLVPD